MKRRDGTRWSVALALGLRPGEALGLCWRNVDLDKGTLLIRVQLQRQRLRHGCDDLRACTDLLLAQGVDQRVVMEILGHSQISMTSRYAHVLPQVMTDAAERIGEALWGRREPTALTRRRTG